MKQPDTGLAVNDDLKHRRATLNLGLLVGSDKGRGRGWTDVRQLGQDEPAAVADWPTKRDWVAYAFDEFGFHGHIAQLERRIHAAAMFALLLFVIAWRLLERG